MNSCVKLVLFSSLILLTAFSSTHAGEVTIPNTFTADTPAIAAEVNANFTAVKTAVDDNDSRMAALETALAALQATVTAQATTISALQSDLAAVQTSQVMALEPYVTVDETVDPRGPLVQVSGANLQITNGAGSTATVNGLGNLIYKTIGKIKLTNVEDGYSEGTVISGSGFKIGDVVR